MKSIQPEWTRRKFIHTITGASVIFMMDPLVSWVADQYDPQVAHIVSRTMGIDSYNHIDVPLNGTGQARAKLDMSKEMKRSGLSAICMTFTVAHQEQLTSGEAYNHFLNGLTAMETIVKSNNMHRALNLSDLHSANATHKHAVIQSVKGTHFLEGKIERLQVAYNRGVRHLGLLNNYNASARLSDAFSYPARWSCLTGFGADVIRECNQSGILIDLSHANEETLQAALKVSRHPVLVSHTGLNTQPGNSQRMVKMMEPHLISKKQAKIIADAGGVIGVSTHLADTPLMYAQNIRAMTDVVGIDHVCIGTGTKLAPLYKSSFASEEHAHESKKYLQNCGAGKRHDDLYNINRSGMDQKTSQIWDGAHGGFYYAVVDALLKTGFAEEDIAKIGGGNFCRIFDAATSGK